MNADEAVRNALTIERQLTIPQAKQLFALASAYDQDGARMLDIGVFLGFSTAMMAQAAPRAKIIALNVNIAEAEIAKANLARCRNVDVVAQASRSFLGNYDGLLFDFIFVDGDHNRVGYDLAWWDYVVPGGMMLFHDYNEPGHGRDSPILRATLDKWVADMGRKFDYHLVDEEGGAGMVGLYRWECAASREQDAE